MNKWMKSLLTLILLLTMNIPLVKAEDYLGIHAPAAMVVDQENGQILYEKNVNELFEIASLTKMLVVYLTYQAIQEGDLSLEDQVEISDLAYEVSQDYGISNVPLRRDLTYSVEELLESVGVTLANGSCVALAEKVAGSQEKFLERMNQQLESWGCQEYELATITGLSDAYQPHNPDSLTKGQQNKASVQTVATIAYHLAHEFPDFLEATAKDQVSFKVGEDDSPFDMVNYNRMLKDQPYEYGKTQGLMVGMTSQGQSALAIQSERNDLEIIAILLGAKDEEKGYRDMTKLLDHMFVSYRVELIVKKGDVARQVGEILTLSGRPANFHGRYSQDFRLVVPLVDTSPRLKYEFKPKEELFAENKLVPPVASAESIGSVEISPKGERLAVLPSATGTQVSIETPEEVVRAPWYARFWRGMIQPMDEGLNYLRRFFTEMFN